MLTRLVYWVLFGLSLALLPIAISCWILCASHTELTFFENLTNCITKGELLIVCTAVLGVNIGDLFKEDTAKRFQLLKFSLFGLSTILALFTGGIYVGIATDTKPLAPEMIAETSLSMLAATIIICISSLSIPKLRS